MVDDTPRSKKVYVSQCTNKDRKPTDSTSNGVLCQPEELWVDTVPIFKSGVDSKLLEAIKNNVKDWQRKDKFCSFIWDEVSLVQHLDYCHSQDKIEGFVEINKGDTVAFATHALTFMVRGFETPFKQATGYFYTNGIDGFELTELVKLMLVEVLKTGKDSF